jgi:hypothetical protein
MLPTRKAAFLLKPADFPIPKGLLYPCFCAACRPSVRRKQVLLQPLEDFMAPRIGAPIPNAPNRNSSDGLLELYTPLLCRRHSGGRDTVTLRAEPSFAIRRRRVLAFLYRCMATSFSVTMVYDVMHDKTPFLPVPPWNLEGHDLDHPIVCHLRDQLTEAGLRTPLYGNPTNEPWAMVAAHAANALEGFPATASESFGTNAHLDPIAVGAALARELADLCAADGAREHASKMVRTIAARVAFEPYPLDVFPWVPRWGPAMYGPADNVNSIPGLTMPDVLRRWWNFEGPTLRPKAFEPPDVLAARHTTLREERYILPMMKNKRLEHPSEHVT